MIRNNPAVRIVAPLLMLAWTLSCRAADATPPTTCKDGTTSTATGRGACSSHGGVQQAAPASAAAPAATPAPSTLPTPAAAPATAPVTVKPAPAAAAPAASAGNTDPAGATAKCKDGTYSKSQHRSGTCSGHGGVAQWMNAAQ
jgi:hypothetical protein